MLDYTFQSSNPSPIKSISDSGALPSKILKEELPSAGSWFRHYTGDLYEVSRIAYCLENSQECLILKKLFDFNNLEYTISPDAFFEKQKKGGSSQELFSQLKTPDSSFYNSQKITFLSPLQIQHLEAYFNQPWRAYHSIHLLYDFFEIIEKKELLLSKEQKLALILKNAFSFPGLPKSEELIKLEIIKIKHSIFENSNFDFNEILKICFALVTKDKSVALARPLLDLENYSLAADLMDFLAYHERIWIENKGLLKEFSNLEEEEIRKDFESRRLRYLINLCSEPPVFIDFLKEEESQAFANVEEVRKAWMAKYAPK